MSDAARVTAEQAKVKKLFEGLLKLPENRLCADCDAKQPRWASTNLGCFFCIRCSGIHRNLGVHISKVKSVTLDKWPLEMAENMADWGNARVNELYEATLPEGRKPREVDSIHAVETFIRNKYEKKMWYKEPSSSSKNKKKNSDIPKVLNPVPSLVKGQTQRQSKAAPAP